MQGRRVLAAAVLQHLSECPHPTTARAHTLATRSRSRGGSPSLALVVEAIDAVDRRALVVTAEDEEVFRVPERRGRVETLGRRRSGPYPALDTCKPGDKEGARARETREGEEEGRART